jgi:hypothetical protein
VPHPDDHGRTVTTHSTLSSQPTNRRQSKIHTRATTPPGPTRSTPRVTACIWNANTASTSISGRVIFGISSVGLGAGTSPGISVSPSVAIELSECVGSPGQGGLMINRSSRFPDEYGTHGSATSEAPLVLREKVPSRTRWMLCAAVDGGRGR